MLSKLFSCGESYRSVFCVRYPVCCGHAFLSFWLIIHDSPRCCIPTKKERFVARLLITDSCLPLPLCKVGLIISSRLKRFCAHYFPGMSSLSDTCPSLRVAAAVFADVAEVFSRGTDLIRVDSTLLHAGSCHTISHVGEDNPSLAASTQTMW